MTITNQNVSLYRGDDAILFVALTDAITGDPFDVSTASAVCYRVATSAHATQAVISKDLDSGVSQAEGGINITLTTEDTDLAPGFYYQELKVFGPGVAVSTAMTGTVTLRRSLKMGGQSQAQLYLVGQSDFAADGYKPPV